jgi:heterodisulfide reductase subunit A
VTGARSLVMIQCVGCRQPDRNYCSRVCCNNALTCALKLKEINPQMDIYILYRDIRSYGFAEDYYREAANREVKFIRYEPEDKPQVEALEEGGQPILRVSVTDPILGKKIAIDADALALAAAIIPSTTSSEIAKLFKVPLSPDGFFQEAHVKLRPVDFAADGIFLCGIAHYPKHIAESIAQAYGAAGRAATILSKDSVTASGAICEVNETKCVGCGQCQSFCKYGAIELHDTPEGKKAKVIPVLCKGCGLCSSKCPTGAITAKHFTDEQIFAEIDTAFPALVEVHQ